MHDVTWVWNVITMTNLLLNAVVLDWWVFDEGDEDVKCEMNRLSLRETSDEVMTTLMRKMSPHRPDYHTAYDTQHFDFGWVEAAVLTVNICSFGRILLLVDFLLDFLCINLLSHSSLLHRQGFLTTVLPLLSFCREETSSGMISSFLIQEVFLQMIIMIIRNNFPSIFKSPTTTCYVTIV